MIPWVSRVLTKLKSAAIAVKKWFWPLPLGLHVAVMLGFAVLASVGIGFVFGIELPSAKDQAAKPFEGIKLVLAIVAGLGGIVALTVAYRKQRVGESAEARERSTFFHERFGAATEQLGSESPDVRTAGAYALAHLADDWDDGRQTCIDVLCAHIRKPYTPPQELPADASSDEVDRNEAREQQRQVRHSILDIIGQRLGADPEPGKTWHGHHFDFRGATIDGGNFSRAKFTDGIVDFTRAKFVGGDVQFRRAQFSGATVFFSRAHFCGANVVFYNAKFSGGDVRFVDTKFSAGTVDFHAQFSGASVSFSKAHFSGANVTFHQAEFSGGAVFFNGTHFSDGTVFFRRTEFCGGAVSFAKAEFSGATVRFGTARFSKGIIDFRARFSAGDIWFVSARFSGGSVDFVGAEFNGGEVRMERAQDWSVPPKFDDFPSGLPPGLKLPTQPGKSSPSLSGEGSGADSS